MPGMRETQFGTCILMWVCGWKLDVSCIRLHLQETVLDQVRYLISGHLCHGGSAITYRARQRYFTGDDAVRE